ncbi:MAG TPA: shikimate dehydrogenase [archaeon]|nr:shikimate dehydrogenase [archaeon]
MTFRKPPITSRTRVLGVIGDPIEHSLSPLMHSYVLERLGLDYRYVAFHVLQGEVSAVGKAFKTLNLAGLNVTLPHKEAVLEQMDQLTEEAQAVGAVNTIGRDEEGRLVGHNTDVAGFLGSLRIRGLDNRLTECCAVVLGAGGAARAVLYALGKSGTRHIILINRTMSRAEGLAGWFVYNFPEVPVEIISPGDQSGLEKALASAYITVNVTPLGMAPNIEASPLSEGLLPPAGTVVYDTVYNPVVTRLLADAEKAGCICVGGLDMLIIQGMESLSWWLKRLVPWTEMIDEIRKKLQAALKEG